MELLSRKAAKSQIMVTNKQRATLNRREIGERKSRASFSYWWRGRKRTLPTQQHTKKKKKKKTHTNMKERGKKKKKETPEKKMKTL